VSYNLGVDVGGTFTDVVVLDEETSDLTVTKVLSTPANPSDGVLTGVGEATERAGATARSAARPDGSTSGPSPARGPSPSASARNGRSSAHGTGR
jgi:N-methylhydantoinase A/oxoprolinase/acetone carboxylase beta subunit